MPKINLIGSTKISLEESEQKKTVPRDDASPEKLAELRATPLQLPDASSKPIDLTPKHPLEQHHEPRASHPDNSHHKPQHEHYPVIPVTESTDQQRSSEEIHRIVGADSPSPPNREEEFLLTELAEATAPTPIDIRPEDVERDSERSSIPTGRKTLLYYILLLLIVLCAGVMLYYLEIIPPLNSFVDRYVKKRVQTVETVLPRESPPPVQTENPTTQQHAFDYYLQISSWEKQYLAERQKDKFLAKHIPAIVESDFISRKRRTYFRVRLGPFPTRDEALKAKSAFAGMIPSDAFVDSILASEVAPIASPPPQKKLSPRKFNQPAEPTDRVPTTGYVITVSSFKQKDLAESEKAKLLSQGYSAFVNPARNRTGWYRVQIGPFNSESEARNTLHAVRRTFGNDAYITNLNEE